MNFLRRMKYEIPFCVDRYSDVARHCGLRAIRRAKVLRGSCAVRGAEVIRNHENPGGRVGRRRRRPGHAADVRCQDASLAARDLAGNRPRMTGKMSPDGKTVEFEFADISGSATYHMHHAVFTIIDADHHTEDWTFMMKDKAIHAHFDLKRAQ